MTQSIFITGAASGIGRATARRFAEGGWFVGLFDINQDALDALAAELPAGRFVTGQLDVTNARAVEMAMQTFVEAAGRFDVLFNSAGILDVQPFMDCPDATAERIFNINVLGLMNGCRAARPHLQAGAKVINMSSASAIYGTPDFAVYSASKHAVRALTEALNIEWSGAGIHVCDIMPPFVRTAMVDNANNAPVIDKLGVKLTPEDIAKTVWKAATGGSRRVHWPLSDARWTLLLQKLVPAFVTRWVTAKLTGYPR